MQSRTLPLYYFDGMSYWSNFIIECLNLHEFIIER